MKSFLKKFFIFFYIHLDEIKTEITYRLSPVFFSFTLVRASTTFTT